MQRRKFLTLMGGTVTTAAFAGCGGGGGGGGGGSDRGQQSNEATGEVVATVTLTDDGFDPMKVKQIPVGGTVEFTNGTGEVRNLAADNIGDAIDWSLNDDEWKPDEKIYYTFSEPGIYAFRDLKGTRYQDCGAIPVGEEYSKEDIPTLPCE